MTNVNLKALFNCLNPYCKRSMEGAAGMCVARSHYEVNVSHLMAMLLGDVDRDLQLILRHYEIEPARLEKALQHALDSERSGNPGKPSFSEALIELLEEAWMQGSIELHMADIRSGLLLLAMLKNQNRFGQLDWFPLVGDISPDDLRKNFFDITAGSKEEATFIGVEKKDASEAQQAAAREDSALAKFTIDFTGQAREGKIDPVFCRDREIRQIIDILSRRRKNNPIAVGEAGVGKTAVVEGLALKIVQGDVPDVLKNVDIIGLDLGLLQAGASVKGEFENRLKAVIEEVKGSPKPIILFIDEAHTLIGAGGPAGGGDAANLLKPALARGELRTVAATTWSEYKKYFEKDPALARRFQLVKLEEPSPQDAVVILRGLRDNYEKAHGVYMRDDAIEAAAMLSSRYISGRQLPDKAVDVLDTAAARVKISVSDKPSQIDDAERMILTLERELNALMRDVEAGLRQEDERTEELRRRIDEIREGLDKEIPRWEQERDAVAELLECRQQLGEEKLAEEPDAEKIEELRRKVEECAAKVIETQGDDPLIHYEVTPEVVGRVISDWTGIPLGKMVKDEAGSVLAFRDRLGDRIKGQDHALDALDRGVRAAKAGLRNPDAPMGVFLLVGPSGVGKTETALGVADILFGGERFMASINMSEFQEKHTVSRLIGSPPGYVGYGEGGVLTEAVRQRPYSVVLLDEVEKADLEVMNLFYQVFDKGVLSDGEGRVIDFRNTVVFLTSNLATEELTQIGLQGGLKPEMDEVVEAIRPILSRHFKPALLARMEIVPYMPIRGEALAGIVRAKLGKLIGRMWDAHKIRLSWAESVVQQIVDRCTEVETGARNIDYIINRNLLPKIASEILANLGGEIQYEALVVGLDGEGNFDFRFLEDALETPPVFEWDERKAQEAAAETTQDPKDSTGDDQDSAVMADEEAEGDGMSGEVNDTAIGAAAESGGENEGMNGGGEIAEEDEDEKRQ